MLSFQASTHPILLVISGQKDHNYKPLQFPPSKDSRNHKYYGNEEKSLIYFSCAQKFRLAAASNDEITREMELPEGLKAELMPKHVAVIMDGNRRWATNRGLAVQEGHRAGGRVLKDLIVNCSKFGVKALTVFSFSTENWIRAQEEVDFLMELFQEVMRRDLHDIIEQDMQVSVIGDKSGLPKPLQAVIRWAEEMSKSNKGMRLLIAKNYSGRYDITQAAKRIAEKVGDGELEAEDVNESLFEQHLETSRIEFPNPDLVIRTSGELRVSNFMLWQLAYSELVFVDKMFPDFGFQDFVETLKKFQGRQRRFGGHAYPKLL